MLWRRGQDRCRERITQEQLEAQADVEAGKCRGARQVDLIRAQLTRRLRLELGHESCARQGIGTQSRGPIRHNNRPPSDRFLDQLDGAATADVGHPLLAIQPAGGINQVRHHGPDLDHQGLTTLAGELIVGPADREGRRVPLSHRASRRWRDRLIRTAGVPARSRRNARGVAGRISAGRPIVDRCDRARVAAGAVRTRRTLGLSRRGGGASYSGFPAFSAFL